MLFLELTFSSVNQCANSEMKELRLNKGQGQADRHSPENGGQALFAESLIAKCRKQLKKKKKHVKLFLWKSL